MLQTFAKVKKAIFSCNIFSYPLQSSVELSFEFLCGVGVPGLQPTNSTAANGTGQNYTTLAGISIGIVVFLILVIVIVIFGVPKIRVKVFPYFNRKKLDFHGEKNDHEYMELDNDSSE